MIIWVIRSSSDICLCLCFNLVVFVDLYLDVFFFVHDPTIVVGDDKSLSDHILDSVFEYERVPYLFGFLVGAIDIEKIIRQGT
ncbi:hypothetical protein JHK84_043925 [Glycine max]|nr:hypothetical protein JHK84_043925 [Glycine max]